MSKCFRLAFTCIAAVVCLTAIARPVVAAGDSGTPCSLESARQSGSVDRVVSVLEVKGVLKAPRKDKVEQSKMGVNATIVYDERTLEAPAGGMSPLRSVRYYDRTDAQIDVPEGKLEPKLSADRSLVAVEIKDAKVTLFSPRGRLTREELDLVDLPANSLLLDRFLPDRPVAEGDAWEHADELVLAAFGLDRLSKQTLTSRLAKVDGDMALMEMSGRIDGAVNGVTTRIEVRGKYRFDRKTRRIDWFGLLVNEDRDVSPVGPGFQVVARLRMQIGPRGASERLSDKALAGVSLAPSDEATQLVCGSPREGWRFEHDRRWFSTGRDRQLAFLRLIERGDFIAQCNVAALAKVEPGKQATLEQFQADIKQALGDGFGEFVSASQKANEQNYRVLKVVARGTVSGLPIEWHYYLVADEQGRQITFTFTVEGPLAERLEQMDERMVASLRFEEPDVAVREGRRMK